MKNPYINCPKLRYHDFKVLSSPYLAESLDTNQRERCKGCGVIKSYSFKPDGKMTNENEYFMDHIRAFAQPAMGDVYYDCNPGAVLKFKKEEKEEKAKIEKEEVRKEHLVYALKRAFEDKDDGILKKK
jgi:hypothetical protein